MAKFGAALSWGHPKLDYVEGWLGKLDFLQCHGGAENWTDFRDSLKGAVERALKSGRAPHLSQPLWAGSGSLEAALNGDYDEHWKASDTAVAAVLRAAGFKDAVISRNGVEWNGSWMKHRAETQQRAQLYGQVFARRVTIQRQLIPQVLIDWNCNRDTPKVDFRWGYPGDQHCDIISIDGYMEAQYVKDMTGAAFNRLFMTEKNGIGPLRTFARERKKGWAIAEMAPKSTTDQQGADWLTALGDELQKDGAGLVYVSPFQEPYDFERLKREPDYKWADVELRDNRPLSQKAMVRLAGIVRSVGGVVPPVTPPVEDVAALKARLAKAEGELATAQAYGKTLEKRAATAMAALKG